MTAHFSLETVGNRRWCNVLELSTCCPRMLYSVKINKSKMKAVSERTGRHGVVKVEGKYKM